MQYFHLTFLLTVRALAKWRETEVESFGLDDT